MSSCGFRTGLVTDLARSSWQNDGPRPIAWRAWYPAEGAVPVSAFADSPFAMGPVSLDAPIAPGRHPVVLLSHGTGGTAESLGWLARFLAGEGFVVLGANHHGNTGAEPYCAEGFLCWWERAADLSYLLTALDAGVFAGALDMDRVRAAGFSLGGYTVLALAGARTSLATFEHWRQTSGMTARGPIEFPDAADQIPHMRETSEAFRTSWARHGDDYSDPRVKALAVIAPAPTIRAFPEASLAAIHLPLTILSGGADTEAPNAHCADWLAGRNPAFRHHMLGAHVGHYTFLDLPADRALIGHSPLFTDHETVDRAQVHAKAAARVAAALR